MYFEKFPRIQYTNVEGGPTKTVVNILRRIGAREAVKNKGVLFNKYNVLGNETPESLAFDFYGNAELHWVLLLVNDIFDRYHDWPMNTNQFQAFVSDKYDNPDDVHHYEISQSSGDTDVTINIGDDNTDYPSATLITNFEYEEKEQDKKRQIKILSAAYLPNFIKEYQKLQSN
jgi:hypothetical protein|tara:strand:+ start:3141 stop:3659 length:519 start_codon:yes stop_codon:yes gene_type:complete